VVSEPMPLFSESEMEDFRSQWSSLQTGFVDEPRRAVEDADKLVASVMQRLAEGFAKERSGLEKQWDSGDNVSTEDLRVALQRYRSFFLWQIAETVRIAVGLEDAGSTHSIALNHR
jgi:hypothetical protein